VIGVRGHFRANVRVLRRIPKLVQNTRSAFSAAMEARSLLSGDVSSRDIRPNKINPKNQQFRLNQQDRYIRYKHP